MGKIARIYIYIYIYKEIGEDLDWSHGTRLLVYISQLCQSQKLMTSHTKKQ
jgi:hypothetical protein